ncbi:MAG: glycosyltransferase family 2 protein [Phaeodactylibacter sp.]|nr:glycosyltransferase family 2 protein [Phaeodactylibacter sp.]MCB9301689.1 glycosyltransferase family 2 protein [Lewinellaceae bacterium]
MLSICITVRNRSKVLLPNQEYAFFLPQCLASLKNALPPGLETEVLISDFGSTDWPLEEWIGQALEGIPYLNILATGKSYHNGLGRNLAASKAKGDFLFFLDADMILPPSIIQNGLRCLKRQKAYYPICFYFLNPGHTLGFWCDGGKGNVFMPREVFLQAGQWPCPPHYQSPYDEDQAFFRKVKATGLAFENQREPGFFHQYHPGRSVDTILKRKRHLIRKVVNGQIL